MFDKLKEIFQENTSRLKPFLNINMLRNIVLFSGGIILFILGIVIYGVILNLSEPTLKEAMREKGFTKLENTSIIIEKRTYSLNLYEDTVLVKTYRANFGMHVNIPKSKADDDATPVGEYKICDIDTVHKYYKFFKINYPNLNDASEALRKNVITQKQFEDRKSTRLNSSHT